MPTPQNWPSTLPQQPSSYSEKPKAVVVRTNPDTGPTKVRKRFTKALKTGQMEFLFTMAQWATFNTFFETTLDGGAVQMNFVHPWTGVSKVMKIMDEPQSTADGPLLVRVNFQTEFF